MFPLAHVKNSTISFVLREKNIYKYQVACTEISFVDA